MTGIVISGFGLSAFFFSTIAHTIFPGNTSDFLLTLAVGTATPMILGWFFIRPCPYPERIPRATTESGDHQESDDGDSNPEETAQLIGKEEHMQPPSINGLVLLRTLDFWILFSIMSLCECICCRPEG